MNTLQKTGLALTLAALAGIGIYEALQISRLREENRSLAAKQEALAIERDNALSTARDGKDELERLQKNQLELVRLRGEVAALRRQTNDLAKLTSQNQQLQAALRKAAAATEPEETPEMRAAIAKMNDAKMLVVGLHLYAIDNGDQLPTNFDQTTAYYKNTERIHAATNQFELLIQGSLRGLTNASEVIAVRQREPMLRDGKRIKAYGFADGHSELKAEPPEGFDAWEKARLLPRTP